MYTRTNKRLPSSSRF